MCRATCNMVASQSPTNSKCSVKFSSNERREAFSHFSHLFLLHALPGTLEGTCWASRGSTCRWFPLCQHTHVASLSPSTLPLPVLIFPFRLHGDSPLWLACIPASARDSEPSSVPPSSRALVPAVLSPPSGVSLEAASSSRHLFSSSDGVSSSGETNPPHPPPATALQLFHLYRWLRGLWASILSFRTLSLLPASHAEVRFVNHFLLSLAWQTGES